MWLLKHWKAALGLLTLIPPTCKAFWEAVGVAGNLDFLITHARDLGWIGDVIGFLLNPPGWAIIPLILAGLGLIWWDVRRPHREAVAGPSVAPLVSASATPAPKPSTVPIMSVASQEPSAAKQPHAAPKTTPRLVRPEASRLLPGWEVLYLVQEDGGIELAFAPDTKQPKKDAFVLLLYAYFILYGDEKIGARRIHGDMN